MASWFGTPLRNSTAGQFTAYIRTVANDLEDPLGVLDASSEILTALSFDDILASHTPCTSFLSFVNTLAASAGELRNSRESLESAHLKIHSLERHLRFAYKIRALELVLRLSTTGLSNSKSLSPSIDGDQSDATVPREC